MVPASGNSSVRCVERVERVDDGVERVVIDLYHFGGVDRLGPGVRHHRNDRFPDEAHHALRQ